MLRKALALLLLVTVALSPVVSSAGPSTESLIRKLVTGDDFRVRVQAALQLGKHKKDSARRALENALGDDNVAVRAAAAAALKRLGDKKALPALRKHRKDSSPSVRAQIESTIEALESAKDAADRATMRVVVGDVKNRASRSKRVERELAAASREQIGELPGVKVVTANDGARKNGLPTVMVTGRLRELKRRREGSEVVYKAKVEYVVHRMPSKAIVGQVSGSATAREKVSKVRSRKRMAKLRRAVIEAAVSSALKRAPEALAAAAE